MNVRNQFICRSATSAEVPPTVDTYTESHLLVYESEFSEGTLSQDIRDVIASFPLAKSITILAPLMSDQEVLESLIAVRHLRNASNSPELRFAHFDAAIKKIMLTGVDGGQPEELPALTRTGWMADLFQQRRCLVHAPDGIHFGKTSGKHALSFLRAANALTGSLECMLLAFFTLPHVPSADVQRIYVDTGPLVAVGASIIEQAHLRSMWRSRPPIESFSSYDGLDRLSRANTNHLVLISASTSGGLAEEISLRTSNEDRIVTLFYIQAEGFDQYQGAVVADLTARDTEAWGYSPIETFRANDCKWCKEGIPAASFEGDQFLLQKRKVDLLNIAFHGTDTGKCSMKGGAKEFFSAVKSRGAISVLLHAPGTNVPYSELSMDQAKVLQACQQTLQAALTESKAAPSLDLLVSDELTSSDIAVFEPYKSGKVSLPAATKSDHLQDLTPTHRANALVAFSCIESVHIPRKINEILRAVTPDGTVSYVAAATLVESPEQFKQLRSALRSGANGPNTFEFEAGSVVILRYRTEALSSWDSELGMLQGIVDIGGLDAVPYEIRERLAWLRDNGSAYENLFWYGQNRQALKLQSDFVFLPVDGSESQADIYAIVCNLVATALGLNRDPLASSDISTLRRALEFSVYSEVLVDPNNFMKFNDAVLRASILRAARPSELNYESNLPLSRSVTDIILYEVSEWRVSRGQILTEFIVALATSRLKLCSHHTESVKKAVLSSAYIPSYVKLLAQEIQKKSEQTSM
ncbi:hypothetical protein [Neorhizobium sp. SHOUNA12B]|uniref:hypothetical protein n=1 Tax=Neorhizobium sp. SHOUNA12B TaxID=2908928 RepID=UPI0025F6D448|nr:hypothetical protein [Neorhizobium sp. SHOUNA12B]MCJ9673680.1 hypothetical protein [Neorhizobium sp. SHOUNA12B]